MTTTLLLARHGQTGWNIEHRWQGDPPLNDTGRAQARSLARSLADERLDAICCSDLLRASQTAEIVAAHLGLPVHIEPQLREIDVGEWTGLTSAELRQRFPDAFARYLAGGPGWQQGESYDAMVARVTSALGGIASAHPDGRVLAVAHAGVLCAAWLASGGRLADWQGTYNGDLQEVVVDGGEIHWVGLAHRAEERGQSEPSLFWRV